MKTSPGNANHRPLYSPLVAVWCTVFIDSVICAVLFLKKMIRVTVKSQRNCAMLLHTEALWLPTAKTWQNVWWPWEYVVPTRWQKTAPTLIQSLHWWEKCFLDMSFLCVTILGGRQVHQIWHPVICSSRGLELSQVEGIPTLPCRSPQGDHN